MAKTKLEMRTVRPIIISANSLAKSTTASAVVTSGRLQKRFTREIEKYETMKYDVRLLVINEVT